MAAAVTEALMAPGYPLFEHDERVALVHRLALLAQDLLDGALVLGLHGHLHLHGLEDHDGVALVDLVPDRALDLPHGPGDVRFDVSHGRGRYVARWTPSSSSAPAMRPTGCPPRWPRWRAPSRARGSSWPTTARPTRPRRWRARPARRSSRSRGPSARAGPRRPRRARCWTARRPPTLRSSSSATAISARAPAIW